jgi:hypothetical protein
MMKPIYMFLIVLLAVNLTAQESEYDVIVLKNGEVYKGTIIELVPERDVRIRTVDDEIMVFAMEDVAEIKSEVIVGEQKETKRPNFLGGGIGYGMPVGDFASKDENNVNAGFADPGWVYPVLHLAYFLTEDFALTIAYQDAYIVDAYSEDDFWRYWYIGAGPLVTLYRNKFVALDISVLLTQTNISVNDDEGTLSADALGFRVGLSGRVAINNYLSVFASVDYFSTKAEIAVDYQPMVTTLTFSSGVNFHLPSLHD